jgi:hypothetical protein
MSTIFVLIGGINMNSKLTLGLLVGVLTLGACTSKEDYIKAKVTNVSLVSKHYDYCSGLGVIDAQKGDTSYHLGVLKNGTDILKQTELFSKFCIGDSISFPRGYPSLDIDDIRVFYKTPPLYVK